MPTELLVVSGQVITHKVSHLPFLWTAFETWPFTAIGAVGVAQETHVVGICKLPDQGAILSRDSSRAGLDAVRAINVVGALYTVAWSASSAGHVHGLGQAFWMALHTLGVLHEFSGLSL